MPFETGVYGTVLLSPEDKKRILSGDAPRTATELGSRLDAAVDGIPLVLSVVSLRELAAAGIGSGISGLNLESHA